MDATTSPRTVKINRWLPYWAVFQADVQQTLRSWVFRTWVLTSLLAATGYLLYRIGAYREAGIIQPASTMISDLLRWTVVVSVTLVVVLTAGSISAERGSLADSVLSRGISRYQYFLGKWHARLTTVLATFLIMGVLWLTTSYFLLHEDLSLLGALLALIMVASLLAAVVSGGVAISAVTGSTLVGIAVLWSVLYVLSFGLSLLHSRVPSPERILQTLPHVLRGHYSFLSVLRLVGWCALVSCLTALVGMLHFSRRDV